MWLDGDCMVVLFGPVFDLHSQSKLVWLESNWFKTIGASRWLQGLTGHDNCLVSMPPDTRSGAGSLHLLISKAWDVSEGAVGEVQMKGGLKRAHATACHNQQKRKMPTQKATVTPLPCWNKKCSTSRNCSKYRHGAGKEITDEYFTWNRFFAEDHQLYTVSLIHHFYQCCNTMPAPPLDPILP